MWWNWEPLFTCGGNIKWYCSWENSVTTFQKTEQEITLWFSNSTGIYLKGLKAVWKGDICKPTFIAHGQKVETTWMSIHGWTDKENVVYPYVGILFSLKKVRNSNTCHNIDEA